LVTRAG